MKLFRPCPVILGLFAAVLACFALDMDTVGLTAVDYQNYGPAWQRVFNLPGTGVYVAWLKTGMSANFYGYSTRTWRGEVGVFGSTRNASGNLDVSLKPGPYFGGTFISSYLSRDPRWPIVAIESVPGSGTYLMRATDSLLMGCQRPPIAFTGDGVLHLLCLDSTSQDTLLYSRSTDYGTNWTAPVSVCGAALPREPTHSICASDSSTRVAAVWSVASEQSLWVNVSDDGGATWSGPQNLLPLPSSISGAKPGRFGAFGFFDRDDRLGIVTQVWDGTNQYPSEIWHWRESRNPAWSMVYRFAPGSVVAPAEPGEPFSLRPSIGQRKSDGRLFVVWMNYDSLNYESETQQSRSDIYVAQSEDGGVYWSRPLRVTGPDNGSRLAPCIAPVCTDTLVLTCVTDQLAGIFELGHGGQTTNTANVVFVRADEIPGIAESGTAPRALPALSILPSPVRSSARILGPAGAEVHVRDCSGRPVGSVRAGTKWNCGRLAGGVYFLSSPGCAAARVVVVR